MCKLVQILLLTAVSVLKAYDADSQSRWVKSYFENEDVFVKCLTESYDLGYLISGKYGANYSKYNWLLKTDINGEILWQKTIGNGINSIALHDCAIDEPGNIYLGGSTKAYDPEGDPLILKLNACGEKEWCRVFYTENNQDFCRCLTITPEGDIITVLLMTNPLPFTDRICLAKLTPAGELTWKKCYTTADTSQRNEDVFDIIQTTDNGFLITGYCDYEDPTSPNRWWLKPYFLKVDSLGEFMWETVVHKEIWDIGGIAWSTVINPDSTFFYASISHYYHITNKSSPALLKMDFQGNVVDIYDIVSGFKEGKLSYAQFINDSMLAASCGWGNNNDSLWSRAVIIDTMGNLLNSQVLMEDKFTSLLQVTHDIKLLYATNTLENDQFDFYLTKLNPNLEDDTIYTMTFTYDSLCPYSIISDTIVQDDCGLIVGIEDGRTVGRYEGEEVRVRVWPNPARGVLSVTIAGQRSAVGGQQSIDGFTIEIYDMFGRQAPGHIASLPPGGGRAGDGGWTVDVSGLVPGIYLAVVRDENRFIGSAKFVVVR